MYYVRVPSLDDYKGLARDQSSNMVRYPTELLAGALSDLMEESGLKEFGLLAHGWSASHLAMRVTSRFRDRVTHLTDHLKVHKKDHHNRRGLLMLVGRRRRMLDYVKKNDVERYRAIIAKLGLRR